MFCIFIHFFKIFALTTFNFAPSLCYDYTSLADEASLFVIYVLFFIRLF